MNNTIDNNNNNLSNSYFNNELNNSTLNNSECLINEDFFEKIKEINILPVDFLENNETRYSDDIWRFFKSDICVNPSSFNFNFNKVPYCFKNAAKDYVLFKILDSDIKISTIKEHFSYLKQFLSYLETDGYFYIEDVDEITISNHLKDRKEKISISAFLKTKSVLREFITFYYLIIKKIPLDKHILNLLNTNPEESKILKAYKEEHKLKNIEEEYFSNFIKILLHIINVDLDAPDFIKGTACLFLILSQTGLRIGECLTLEIDSLRKKDSLNGDYELNYLYYKTWKNRKGNYTYKENIIFVNKLTKLGYEKLVDLYKEKRENLNTKLLYLGYNYIEEEEESIPINHSAFRDLKLKFFAYIDKYVNTINLDSIKYPYLSHAIVPNNKKNGLLELLPNKKDIKTVSYPKNHQFRVYVCSYLYHNGVPLEYIEKFMSHLSNEMQGYYVRPKKKNPQVQQVQEDTDFSKDILTKIVKKDLKILGEDKGLTKKIDTFIKDNHYNVEKDLDTIVEKLCKSIPIRQKTGGVCIKSSIGRECSKDYKTNEFYCAYNVCPNIYHFYYMANVSYKQALDLVESIKINKSNGHIRQVQKETNMLNKVSLKLLKELDELKNMLEKRGINAVLVEYPDLEHIVNNFDEVYKEVQQWKVEKA